MRLRVGLTAFAFLAGFVLPAMAQETVEPDTDIEAELDCELDPFDPFDELPDGKDPLTNEWQLLGVKHVGEQKFALILKLPEGVYF